MKAVDPIRDKYLLQDIERYLRTKECKTTKQEFKRDRNYLMFLFGIHEGRRISDILKIRVGDIKTNRIELVEQKTGKSDTLYLHEKVIKEINKYIKKYDLKKSDYLFPSQKKKNGIQKPLGRQGAYSFLKRDIQEYFGDKAGLIGTHTLRKTFGYMYYTKTGDVVMLQKLFNHSDPAITLEYIGITKDQKRSAIEDFDPFN